MLCVEVVDAVLVGERQVVVVVVEVAAMVVKWSAGVNQDWIEEVCPLKWVSLVCLQI